MELIHNYEQTMDGDMLRITIQNKYNSLSKAARRIADFLLEYKDRAAYMNITTLANKVNVSEGTVTKFARTIGYNSFSELKIALAQGVHKSGDIEEGILASSVDAIQGVFLENINALRDTLMLLDIDKIYDVARRMIRADKTDIYGIGTTSAVAEYLHAEVISTGLYANYYCDPHKQKVSASLLAENDVAVGISISGQSAEVANALANARSNGATTVCITNHDHSPVVQESDIVLFTASGSLGKKKEENDNIISRVSEFSLADALYKAILALKNEKN